MRPFSYADFTANPLKYRLFTTARVAVDIPHTEIKAGDYVGIEYLDTRPNAVYISNPDTPIYAVKGAKHFLFANALCDFCL